MKKANILSVQMPEHFGCPDITVEFEYFCMKMNLIEGSCIDQDGEKRYENIRANQDIGDSTGPSQHSGGRVYKWVAMGFGLLCILQVILNISLRLAAYSSSEGSQLETYYNNLMENRDGSCPQCWIKFAHSCYYISSVKKTWTESRQECLNRGADLVIINSREEQDFIRSFNTRAWIGLTDTESEGTWRWVDGTLLNMSYWNIGEPNDLGITEDCVEFKVTGRDPLKAWNDAGCMDQNTWICESPLG